jgi:hypothetical protein
MDREPAKIEGGNSVGAAAEWIFTFYKISTIITMTKRE